MPVPVLLMRLTGWPRESRKAITSQKLLVTFPACVWLERDPADLSAAVTFRLKGCWPAYGSRLLDELCADRNACACLLSMFYAHRIVARISARPAAGSCRRLGVEQRRYECLGIDQDQAVTLALHPGSQPGQRPAQEIRNRSEGRSGKLQ